MGHAYIENLSEVFIKHLYAKGSVSIYDVVKFAHGKGELVHASERDYDEEYMLEMMFYYIVSNLHFREDPVIRPLPTILVMDIIKRWRENNLSDKEMKKIRDIKWVFARHMRKKYPNYSLPVHYYS